MKAYLIDAAARTIVPIDYTYTSMREHLPGGICIGATFDNGDVLYVDDEGLLQPATKAFRIRRRRDRQPMMSNGILTGRDNPDPRSTNTLPPAMSIEELAGEIEWMSVDDALTWFRRRSPGAAVTSGDAVLATWGDFIAVMEGTGDRPAYMRPHGEREAPDGNAPDRR